MADVNIDTTVSTASARGMRAVVFTTDLIGYWFYIDSTGDFGYSKTTDGGATWGAKVTLHSTTAFVAFDIWFDQWTPGDTGANIYLSAFDSTNDAIIVGKVQTASSDSYVNVIAVSLASAVAGRGAFVSVTKTRSNYVYVAFDIDAGAERGFYRSANFSTAGPGGSTWSANLSTTFIEATLDTCKLFPDGTSADPDDCWAVYYDASATAITLKQWDASAGSQVESATIGVAHTDGATDLTGQFGYSGAIRHSDGHLILAKVSQRDNAASTHQVFDITDTSTITTKTAITTNIDDHYYPQVFIDQATNAIYVAYNGKRDGSEVMDTTTKVYYTKSTDGGTTWTAGDTAYMEGAAGVVQQVWCSQSGRRFYVGWRVGTTLLGNKVNSVVMAVTPTISAGSVASTVVVQAPTLAYGLVAPGMVLADSYAFSNLVSTAAEIYPAYGVGQTFLGNGQSLDVVTVLLRQHTLGSAGSLYASVYATTGTPGTDATPTGSPLAASSVVLDVSTLTKGRVAPYSFPFVGADAIALTNGAAYAFILDRRDDVGIGEAVLCGQDTSSPTHAGNYVETTDMADPVFWDPSATRDLLFQVWTRPGAQTFAPTVEAEAAGGGAQAVTSATLASSASPFAPTLAAAVTTATCASTAAVSVPALAYALTTATQATSAQVFAPTLTPSVLQPTITSTALLFAPLVVPTQLVTTATIAAGSGTSAPTLAVAVVSAILAASTTLFPPRVVVEGAPPTDGGDTGAIQLGETLSAMVAIGGSW